MIVRTEAVVLRSMRYRETSLIVTLFTHEQGRVSVLAKGARLTRSRFGATLQPMAHIEVLYAHKSTRTLHTLRESAHLTLHPHLRQDLGRTALGYRMIELVAALMPQEAPNAPVFELLKGSLTVLDQAEGVVTALLPYFQLRLATLLGFGPAIERDVVAQVTEAGGVLVLDTGAVVPLEQATSPSVRSDRSTLRAFAICARADLDVVLRTQMDVDVQRRLVDLVDAYLRYHLEESYPTRSQPVLRRLVE
ncbi:MAG: DNA repair protein RecO [Bacteroidota bacterium]